MEDITMQSMTYGAMPSRDEFTSAFDRECPDGYEIQLNRTDSRAVEGFRLDDGSLSESDLWFALREINDADPREFGDCEQHERAMDVVSSIMFTLGFEWI
jgi:hypothetical protein